MMQVDFLLRPQYLRWGGMKSLKEAAMLALDPPHLVDPWPVAFLHDGEMWSPIPGGYMAPYLLPRLGYP